MIECVKAREFFFNRSTFSARIFDLRCQSNVYYCFNSISYMLKAYIKHIFSDEISCSYKIIISKIDKNGISTDPIVGGIVLLVLPFWLTSRDQAVHI